MDSLRRLADFSECIFLLDPTSGLILEANPACEEALGFTSEKMIGRSLSQWVRDPVKEDLLNAFTVTSRGVGTRVFQLQFQSISGQLLPMEVEAFSVSRSSGPALQLVARIKI